MASAPTFNRQRVSLTTKAAAAAAMPVTASVSTACGQRSSGRWNSGLLPTRVRYLPPARVRRLTGPAKFGLGQRAQVVTHRLQI